MADLPYTREEVLAVGDQMPGRGPVCHGCGEHIPGFAELSEADEWRVRHLRREGRVMAAIAELRAVTGCSPLWAKLWVEHEGQPKPSGEDTPCPYCSRPLRTSLARQCRFCHADWHDTENLPR